MDAPNKLILRTGSVGNFEGKYSAVFKTTEEGTVGTFTETATALSFSAKLTRLLFVDQAEIIDRYTENARKEIVRRSEVSN